MSSTTERPESGTRALPYPDITDVAHATREAADFFRSYFTAKTNRDIEATYAHFHPERAVYFDATLRWSLFTNADVRRMWQQVMPGWPATAKSYPTEVLGDTTSAVVFMTDTPELFGSEIRAIAVADMQDGKLVRLVDYWDGRAFGTDLVNQMRAPVESFTHDMGASAVTDRVGTIADVAHALDAAFAAGDSAGAAELFANDALFEDMPLRTQIRGKTAISRYLQRALPGLPYASVSIRHIVGTDQGGGYEWHHNDQAVPRGAIALALDPDGQIARLTAVWDGSLIDDNAIKAAVTHAVDS